MGTQNNCETIITKLIIHEKPTYIKVLWEDNETEVFSIQIFFEDNCWKGYFTHELANQNLQRFKQTKKEYLIDVKSSLLKMNPMFKYDFIVSNKSTGIFSWKKKFDGSVFAPHGSLEVQLSDTPTKNLLIDSLIVENQSLKSNLAQCKTEIMKSHCDLRRYTDEIDNLQNINSLLEETLMGKFVKLLNTKKRRIQILEDALNNIENSHDK